VFRVPKIESIPCKTDDGHHYAERITTGMKDDGSFWSRWECAICREKVLETQAMDRPSQPQYVALTEQV